MKTRTPSPIPCYRRHKGSNQGYVNLDGRRVYLGRDGLPETEEAYNRLIAEWLENGRRLPCTSGTELTVTEFIREYWDHAQDHYRKPDGTPTSMVHRIKKALRSLRTLYGATNAADFGPNKLRALRHTWIEEGLARRTVNDYTDHVKRAFRWAVSHELVPASVDHGLQSLRGLQRGRSRARETEPVKPVPEAHIEAVRRFLSSQVKDLVDLQLLTGARGGELLLLRAIDFDRSRPVWTARLGDHKTAHRDRERVLLFGPRAQRILMDRIVDRPLGAYLFSPQEAEAERHAMAPTHRRADQKPNARKTDRRLGLHYTPGSYRKAIARACEKAGVPVWTPHRLRHNAGTAIRKEFGLEAAQVILGHSSADVTQVYAERDEEKAIGVIAEIG